MNFCCKFLFIRANCMPTLSSPPGLWNGQFYDFDGLFYDFHCQLERIWNDLLGDLHKVSGGVVSEPTLWLHEVRRLNFWAEALVSSNQTGTFRAQLDTATERRIHAAAIRVIECPAG
jgi:hypothetical protein